MISNGKWQKFLIRNRLLWLRADDASVGERVDSVNAENINTFMTF